MKSKALIVGLCSAGLLLPVSAQAFPLGRWAYPDQNGYLYSQPNFDSRKTGKMHWLTEDGFLEVYRITSSSRRDQKGREWIRVSMPSRPRGRSGWVPRDRIGRIHYSRKQLRLDKRHHRAALWYKSSRGFWHRVWSAPIAVGKAATPTPRGNFWVREKIRNLRSSGLYGPWAFGTSAYSVLSEWPGGGVVGLHGTNQPWLIGRSVSHGCVRMHNRDITRLAHHLEIGVPVLIR